MRETIYNNVFVYERNGRVVMSFGKNDRYWTESIYDPSDERALPVPYTRYMTVALAYADKLDSIAEIGFGGGRTAWYLHTHLPDVPLTSVELDPDVIELAKKYFGIREEKNFTIESKDGRLFLVRGRETYDVIYFDAYRGPFVPFHLLTTEFYETAKERLAPGGVVAQNIHTSTMLFEAAVRTMGAVFDNIDLYAIPGTNNVVAVAYDGPPKAQDELMERAAALQADRAFRYPLPPMIEERRIVRRMPEREPLTDDFAPVETLKAIERHNAGIGDLADRPGKESP